MLLFLQLTVVQGDLVQMAVDAVVHPTNSSLSFGGQIGQCVHCACSIIQFCSLQLFRR